MRDRGNAVVVGRERHGDRRWGVAGFGVADIWSLFSRVVNGAIGSIQMTENTPYSQGFREWFCMFGFISDSRAHVPIIERPGSAHELIDERKPQSRVKTPFSGERAGEKSTHSESQAVCRKNPTGGTITLSIARNLADPLTSMKSVTLALLCLLFVNAADRVCGQSLGNAGTIEGTVTDPSGAAIPKAQVTLRNAVSGYSQSTESGSDGSFRLSNIPPIPIASKLQPPASALLLRASTSRTRFRSNSKLPLRWPARARRLLSREELSRPSKTIPRRTSMSIDRKCSNCRPSIPAEA